MDYTRVLCGVAGQFSFGLERGTVSKIKYLAWQPAITYSVLTIAAYNLVYVQYLARVRSPFFIIT